MWETDNRLGKEDTQRERQDYIYTDGQTIGRREKVEKRNRIGRIRKTNTELETGNTNIRERDHTVIMVDTQTWRPAFEPKLRFQIALLSSPPCFFLTSCLFFVVFPCSSFLFPRTHNHSRQMAAALEHVHVCLSAADESNCVQFHFLCLL